jgi:hypothetical protein
MSGTERRDGTRIAKLSLIWAQEKHQLVFVMIALAFGTVLYLTILK